MCERVCIAKKRTSEIERKWEQEREKELEGDMEYKRIKAVKHKTNKSSNIFQERKFY